MKLAWIFAAAALVCPAAAQAQVKVTVLQQFTFPVRPVHPPLIPIAEGKVAFDDEYMYVASPGGEVFRTPVENESGPLEQIMDRGPVRNALTVSGGALYVLNHTTAVPDSQTLQHSILKSTDHGNTFVPVDEGLKFCEVRTCMYLPATRLMTDGSLIYTNAGGGFNLLVSSNEGKTWKVLSGWFYNDVCTHPSFDIKNRTVVQGGECKLDDAFLKQGTLASSLIDWAPGGELKPTKTPFTENRNVNAVGAMPYLPIWFATAEGAILRSLDNGRSFSFVLERPVGDPTSYPYLLHILFPSKAPTAVIAAGWDKAVGFGRPYLVFSPFLGEGWINLSSYLPPSGDNSRVSDMAEDPQGRIVIVITDNSEGRVTVARIQPSF